MQLDPITNDPDNPLISILIFDYYSEHLKACFESIITQDVLNNFEIIYFDNESSDGSWETALEYARKYDGVITLKRGRKQLPHTTLQPSWDSNMTLSFEMTVGKYCVFLRDTDAFNAKHIKSRIEILELDPLARCEMVHRRHQGIPFRPGINKKPLVNILIHNWNYGRYLKQCLDSVFAQTYENIEIIFSDNASDDESWEIAVEYERKYPGKMTIIRNRKNFGPNVNLGNCYRYINGRYFCVLCSDDALMPRFVERCVNALETNPDTGYAMVHRTIVDENNNEAQEPPFYNQSCIIPGDEQAAVYMMAAVNPSISQIMYSQEKTAGKLPTENILSRWFAQRILDFNLCCDFSMAYIKEPLLINRIHSESDSSDISKSMVEIFGQYILPHQFAEIALAKSNFSKPRERLPLALKKLSSLCLRYSTLALTTEDEMTALRYYHLAIAIMPEIRSNEVFQVIENYWTADPGKKSDIITILRSTDNLSTRTVSYDPPSGYRTIEAGA